VHSLLRRIALAFIAAAACIASAHADERQACSYNLSPLSANVPAGGSTNQLVGVITSTGCAWLAEPSDPWITISSGQSGSGPGTVSYSVAANQGPARNGSIAVATKTFAISQANGCAYTLQPPTQSQVFPPLGGTGGVAVTTFGTCPYTAASNAPWITITSGANYLGTQVVEFSVSENVGNLRTGTMTIAGQQYEISQQGGCTYILSSPGESYGAGSATGSFTVTANVACAWTAESSDGEWLIVTSGQAGQGNGVVQYTVVANTGPERVATIAVQDAVYTVTQAGGCTYSIGPTQSNPPVPAVGGTGLFNVSTNSGCPWDAESNDDWIQITEASGSGSGPVRFSVAANPGPARDGTITAAGHTYTVHQADGCVYFVTPTGVNFTKFGGNGQFSISANADCAWEAISDSAWLTVGEPETGFGPATVPYSVAVNLGIQRTGSINVRGAALLVTQSAGCAYDIDPKQQSFPTTGGDGSFDVNTTAECPWTPTTTANWIAIETPQTVGPGTAEFTVAANAGPDRTGTIVVGDQVFEVEQLGVCTFAVQPLDADFPETGGAGMFAVQTRADCAWTAESNAAWIVVTPPGAATGPGAVAYTVAANVGPERTGEVAVEGIVHTVTQAENCSYAIAPDDADFTADGGDGAIALTATAGCAWTVQEAAPWIAITSATSGTGDATVTYAVDENEGAAREATITVAGIAHVVRQGEPSLADTCASLGVVGSAGYVDISTFAVEGAKGAADEIALPDLKTGRTTIVSPVSLAADANGNVSGALHLRVVDGLGQTVGENDVPVAGRIVRAQRNTISKFPNAGSPGGIRTLEAIVVSGKATIAGTTADRAWSAKIPGAEKVTVFLTDGAETSSIGEKGFLLKPATKTPFAAGKGVVRILGWDAEDAEMVFTRATFLPDAALAKWTADAVVVSPFFDDPVPGGASTMSTTWYVAATDKPGKVAIKGANGLAKAAASGFNFTTREQAGAPEFVVDDLQFRPTKLTFATPAAKSSATFAWDPRLLEPAPAP